MWVVEGFLVYQHADTVCCLYPYYPCSMLVTHSCTQVLCDRLGIFVDGQLVCIGNPKELTARYGGYLVSIPLVQGFSVATYLHPFRM